MKVTRRLRQRVGEQLAPAARELAGRARDRLAERLEPLRPPHDQSGDQPGDQPGHEPGHQSSHRGNRPRAVFAGVLDGRHLWLAVDATPGTLALRETGGDSRLLPLTSDLPEDDPRYRSVRSDLATVPGAGEARWEVVITAPGGKVHRVWTPPLAPEVAVRPPERDGVQWRVARSDDGTLQLHRSPAPAAALLLDIGIDSDDVTTLRVSGAPEGAELRLVDDETGEVLATRPLHREAGAATATIAPTDVPDRPGLSASVFVGDLPVRRRANGLARPGPAVLLPQVAAVDAGESDTPWALVFRWLADGVLRVRRPGAAS